MIKNRTQSSEMHPYTVFCQYLPGTCTDASWKTLAVKIAGAVDAENAANEACLYLLWKQMGQASGLLVVDGQSKCHVPDNTAFDAEEYDDYITFGAKILSVQTLD